MTADVDPENTRPAVRYLLDTDSTWYYVDDGLASTIVTDPATDAESGDRSSALESDECAGEESTPDPERRIVRRTRMDWPC